MLGLWADIIQDVGQGMPMSHSLFTGHNKLITRLSFFVGQGMQERDNIIYFRRG